MKRILIAVITEGDQCVAPFCSSLVQSVKAGLREDVELFPVFYSSLGNWNMAFNQAITLSWRENLDGFVCISPRVSWEPSDLIALLQTNKDAVGLPVANRDGFDIDLEEIARLQTDEESGEIKVRSCSLDFFYLSPYSVDALCKAHPLINYKGDEIKLILQSGDIYEGFYDPSDILAYRLREQGIETWVSSNHTAHRQDLTSYANSFKTILRKLKGQ
jgi:hypothetical protein